VEHRFTIENIYEEDAHIESVSSSCGCSSPQINKTSLKTWEKAEVTVTVDTRGFLGQKDATITVVFDKPFPAEVQIPVHTYIRSDIVVQPGAVLFGSVNQGVGAAQTVAISYAGRDDWRIDRVECANPNIKTDLVETNRAPGLVSYRLTVQLKPDAPSGYLQEPLILVTNDFDARSAHVPVAIEGLVTSALTVRPSPLSLGVATIGQPVTRNLVVQGRTPFRITAVHCDDARFECKLSGDAKSTHVLPITFLAKDAKSVEKAILAKIRVETDLNGVAPVEVMVSVQVVPVRSTTP